MNLLFMGKPGAGKGSVTKRLEGEFKFLSTGDLLRAEVASNSEEGKIIGALLKQGKFATDEQIFPIVEKFLEENKGKNIVFDGFPRNLKQAEECIKRGITFATVVNIQVDDSLVEDRVVNRRIHPASGRVYNIKSLPPQVEGKDDVTGEPLIQRDDDKPDVVKERLSIYANVTAPILPFMEKNGYKVNVVDGSLPIDEQVKMVQEIIDGITNNHKKRVKP